MRVIRLHYANTLRRLFIFISILLFFIIFVFRKKRYSDSFVRTATGIEPKFVWEFVADFTNQQRINPAILDIEIENEQGNYENWEYSVVYREYSVTFPFVEYQNKATFKVLPKTEKGKLHHLDQPYRILSDFNTCTLGFCLQTIAEMKFLNGDTRKSTRILETVEFDCPPILSILCFRDLRAQKAMIYDNIVNSIDIME